MPSEAPNEPRNIDSAAGRPSFDSRSIHRVVIFAVVLPTRVISIAQRAGGEVAMTSKSASCGADPMMIISAFIARRAE